MIPARVAVAIALCLLAACKDREQTRAETPTPTSPSVPVGATTAPSSTATPSASASVAPTTETAPRACADLVAGGPPTPRFPQGFSVRGIDASTPTAWASAKQAGVSFALVQAMMGGRPNDAFAKNWETARACGLKRGAYLFLSPKVAADTQAERFADLLSDIGEIPPIVDVELTPGCKGPCCELSCDDWKSTVAGVLARVEKRVGVRPLVYTVAPFWKECLCNTSRFADHQLWLAGYPKFDADPRPGFGGWQRWVFYQAQGNARLGAGVVDTDVFRGDEAALDALGAPLAKRPAATAQPR